MSKPRLSEEQVHQACAEIASQGEKPTSLALLDKLGRGSLTTITKYLNSWNKSDEAVEFQTENLPLVVSLPDELNKEGEDLIKKVWHLAKQISDSELEVEREALRQAEITAKERIEEAEKFSENQNAKIEQLEDAVETLKLQLNDLNDQHQIANDKLLNAEKANIALSKDNEQLSKQGRGLQEQLSLCEKSIKTLTTEQKAKQAEFNGQLQEKQQQVSVLDLQLHKLQSSLDASVKENEALKNQLEQYSGININLEKLNLKYERSTQDLKEAKAELKSAKASLSKTEKQVAKLEGQLEIYQLQEK